MKKILLYSGLGIGILVLILLILPFAFKGKIREMIKKSVNEQVHATVNFSDDISLSFIMSFPDLRLSLRELSVVGKDSFRGDTLVYFPEFHVGLDLWKAITGKGIEVHKISLVKPYINIQYLPSGRANWDIMKPSADTAKVADTAAAFSMKLKQLTIEKGRLVYHDRSLGFYTALNSFNHEMSGDFGSDAFTLKTKIETPDLTLGYGGVNWLSGVKTLAEADVEMDMNAMKFTFAGNKLTLNELEVETKGFVDMNENDMEMDISFKALQNTFKNFLSLVPGAYSSSFSEVKASGNLSLEGFLKGKMTETAMPATQVKLQVSNGAFSYPGMPNSAKDIGIDFAYYNPDGSPDKSVIDLKKFYANLGGDILSSKALVKTPVSDPYVDAMVKGTLDLGKLAGLIPSAKEAGLAGTLKADIEAVGHYSSVTEKRLGKLDARGDFDLRSFKFNQKEGLGEISIEGMNLHLSPKLAELKECKGVLGKSDFDIKGEVKQLLGYVLNDETLIANVSFSSKEFNCNTFLSENAVAEEPKPDDTALVGVIPIPQNIDALFKAKVGKLIYDNFIFKQFNGRLHVHDAKIDLEEVKAEFLGGDVLISGVYDSKNIYNPFADMKTRVNKVSISESFKYFALLRKFAPIAKNAQGLFSASIDLSSILNQHMQPNYNSMNVDGSLSITEAAVQNVDFIKQLAEKLQLAQLGDLKLKAQTLKFSIKNGVFVLRDSLLIPLGQGISMKLGGNTKLNQQIAYGGWIKVPRAVFGKGNKILENWAGQAKKEGIDISTSEYIPVDVAILGTLLKPDVKVSLKGIKNSVMNQIKEQGKEVAKEKIDEQLEKGREEARKRADEIRSEAKRNADKVRREASEKAASIRSEGDRLANATVEEAKKKSAEMVSKAKNPIERLAAEKAGKKLVEEAEKKATQIRAEANKKAQAVEDAGEKQAKTIEEEAEKKAKAIESV